jgi:hypothetical protein
MIMKKVYILITALLMGGSIILSGCGNNDNNGTAGSGDSAKVTTEAAADQAPREGDLCSVVKDSTGESFGIVKVLKIEGDTYHLRTYGVSYDRRPTENELKDIRANHSAGIGHLPLSRQQFEQWDPRVISNQPVTLEELEGYNIWKNGQKK